MNLILKAGQWLEKHFPEKIPAELVHEALKKFETSLNELQNRISTLENKNQSEIPVLQDHLERIKKIEEHIKTLQTQAIFKSRVVGSVPDTMTPFASKMNPVMPVNGGNK